MKAAGAVLSLFPVLAWAAVAPAQNLQNENLIVTVPKGYKVGHQQKVERGVITELVPEGQTVQNWTEMVTVQIFFRLGHVTPAQYRTRIENLWSGACPGSSFSTVSEGLENGYPALVWRLDCPTNKQTGKPEITWMKFVQGRDSFYIVQKAFKYAPPQNEISRWTGYLATVRVCDSRLPDRPCRLSQ